MAYAVVDSKGEPVEIPKNEESGIAAVGALLDHLIELGIDPETIVSMTFDMILSFIAGCPFEEKEGKLLNKITNWQERYSVIQQTTRLAQTNQNERMN